MDPGDYVSQVSEADLAKLLQNINAFLPSLKELRALYPNLELRAALLALSEMGPEAVAVKLGSEGSLVWDQKSNLIQHIPAISAQVVDLTGAGDAYCGGFMVGLVETGDAFMAAKFGSVSASLVIEKIDMHMALRFNRYQANIRLNSVLA